MLANLVFPLALLTAILTALGTGSLFAFSSFVLGALNRLPPPHAIAAMQSINIVVINPLFMGAFMGSAICFAMLAIATLAQPWNATTLLVLAAAFLCIVGMIGVTMIFNVPLNSGLAVADPTSADAPSIWSAYCGGWQMWNHIRTAAATLSLALLIVAIARMRMT